MRAIWLTAMAAAVSAMVVAAAPVGAATTAPAVSSFTPKLGAVGATVTVSGARFALGATTVTFHGVSSDTVSVLSATRLTATVPAGATTGQIGVTTAGGSGHSTAGFTVADAPTVTGLQPSSGKIGATVTITGTSFNGATGVTFGGTRATFSVKSATSIRATVPKGATTGPVDVTIPGATGGSASDFTVLLPPTISSFTPTAALPGDDVTIDGANFTPDLTVKFGSKVAAIDGDVASGEFNAIVPANVTAAKITVSNTIGSGTSTQSFTPETTAHISSFSPTSGKSGTSVTIAGGGFAGVTGVEFNGVPAASFSVVSSTKMTAVVGPNASAGPISVTNDVGTASSRGNFNGTSFVLRDEMQSSVDSTDPAIDYESIGWQIEYVTGLTLMGYPDAAGQAGTMLQPDAAASFPDISGDGLTYTFTIRDGLAFPDGEAVTAQTFKDSIERSLDPALSGPGGAFLKDVVGESDYVNGDATSISGIAADGMTLTFTLTNNDPDFIARIAMPFFSAVPEGTPHSAQTVIPSAGPYSIDSISDGTIKLLRNPDYGGTRPAYPDEIDIKQNVSGDSLLPDISSGANADFTNTLSTTDASTALSKYPKQTALSPFAGFRYFALNTSRTALSSPAARQAINLLLNRTAIANVYGVFGGTPTDQYLTPTIPGYTDANIYPLKGPSSAQIAQAKTLAQSSGLSGSTLEYWTCTTGTCASVTSLVQSELSKINVTLHVTTIGGGQFFQDIGTQGAAFDIAGPVGWIADYNDPFDILNALLDGTSIQPTNNVDFSYFDDPTYNQKLEDAELLTGADRYSTYGALDVDIAKNQAPLAAISTLAGVDFFAPRIGCRIHQPTYGTDFAALCTS